MAKKQETLTPEERLQAALVPEGEQPYKVPGNWCWIRISDIAQILNGFAFKSQMYVDSGIRIIRISNVQDGYIEDNKPVFYPLDSQDFIKSFMLRDRDLLMSLTGNVGRVAIIDKSMLPAALNQRVACIRMLNPDHNIYFLLYYFSRKEFIQDCIKNSKGSAQLNMSTEWLKGYPIPLPPLAEQQRIVDRIESLFAKLDEVKQKAQDALDSFETRKAAILHKAFTGELTAQWRKEHGVGMESWERIQFGDLTSDVRLGLVRSKAEQSYENLHPYLKMNNITSDGTINIADIVNVDATEDEVELFALQYGDFLFNTRNSYELVGKNAVWNIDLQSGVLFNNNIMRVRFKHGINPFLVSFYLNSKEGKKKLDTCKKNTTNIAAIYAKNLNQIQIPIMSKDEQTEIVRLLDDLLTKEQQAKEAAEGVLEQIDLIKKAILARAFRGELDTNDPSEESAVELLKKLL